MTVAAPPRPPSQAPEVPDSRPLERDEIEALVEALIEEARRETRRRHRRYWALAALAASVGAVILILLDGGAASQTTSSTLAERSSLVAAAATPRIAFISAPQGLGQRIGGGLQGQGHDLGGHVRTGCNACAGRLGPGRCRWREERAAHIRGREVRPLEANFDLRRSGVEAVRHNGNQAGVRRGSDTRLLIFFPGWPWPPGCRSGIQALRLQRILSTVACLTATVI